MFDVSVKGGSWRTAYDAPSIGDVASLAAEASTMLVAVCVLPVSWPYFTHWKDWGGERKEHIADRMPLALRRDRTNYVDGLGTLGHSQVSSWQGGHSSSEEA